MTATNGKSTAAGLDAADLERQANEIRAELDRTLDALERKFSPAQLLDRSLGYLREHGGELTQNVGDVVRRNPVPVLMTLAGVTWLIAASARSSRTARDETLGDESSYGDAPGRSRFQDRVAATRERIRTSREAAANKFAQAASVTREQTRLAQTKLQALVDEQPLLWGGIAIALGALIGAVLPISQYENRTVGQVRDRAVEQAKRMGERQYENLRSKLETYRDVEVSGQAH